MGSFWPYQYDAPGWHIPQTTSDGGSGSWAVTEGLKLVSDPMLFGRHIAELNATNNALVRSYVWGLDLSGSQAGAGGVGGLLWVTLHTGSGPAAGTHFAAYDGNGNIVALSAASDGSETARYEYGPFGEPIRVSGPAAALNAFRFSTKRTDPTTDLVLYEYRAYSPALGRWLSRDPIGELGGQNLYTLAGNDPLQGIDPDGRAAVLVIGGVAVTVADCAILATLTCLAIPPCRDTLIDLVKAGLREIADCIDNCRTKRARCRPCIPPPGTRMYRVDKVPPSQPHWPFEGTHTHHYVVNQSPVTAPKPCFCHPIETHITEGESPEAGEVPHVRVSGGGVEYY